MPRRSFRVLLPVAAFSAWIVLFTPTKLFAQAGGPPPEYQYDVEVHASVAPVCAGGQGAAPCTAIPFPSQFPDPTLLFPGGDVSYRESGSFPDSSGLGYDSESVGPPPGPAGANAWAIGTVGGLQGAIGVDISALAQGPTSLMIHRDPINNQINGYVDYSLERASAEVTITYTRYIRPTASTVSVHYSGHLDLGVPAPFNQIVRVAPTDPFPCLQSDTYRDPINPIISGGRSLSLSGTLTIGGQTFSATCGGQAPRFDFTLPTGAQGSYTLVLYAKVAVSDDLYRYAGFGQDPFFFSFAGVFERLNATLKFSWFTDDPDVVTQSSAPASPPDLPAFQPTLPIDLGNCALAPQGLVAWLNANSTAQESVSGTDAIWTGNPTYTNGRAGQAFSVGNGDSVLLPFQQAGPFTLDAWVRAPDALQPAGTGVIATGSPGQMGTSFQIDLDGLGNYRLRAGNDDVVWILGPATDVFRHVAVTFDGSTIAAYLDGVLVRSAAWTGSPGLGFHVLTQEGKRCSDRRRVNA
jgi:hypothetical protein